MRSSERVPANSPRVCEVYDLRYAFFEVSDENVDSVISTVKTLMNQLDGNACALPSLAAPSSGNAYTKIRRLDNANDNYPQITQIQMRDAFALCVITRRMSLADPPIKDLPISGDTPHLMGQRRAVYLNAEYDDIDEAALEALAARYALATLGGQGYPAVSGAADTGIAWRVRFDSGQPLWFLVCDELKPNAGEAATRIVGRDLVYAMVPEVKIAFLYEKWKRNKAEMELGLTALSEFAGRSDVADTTTHEKTVSKLLEEVQVIDAPLVATTALVSNGSTWVFSADINLDELAEAFDRIGFRPFTPATTHAGWILPSRHRRDSLHAAVRFVGQQLDAARAVLEICRLKAGILAADESVKQTEISEQRRRIAEDQSDRQARWNLVVAAISTAFAITGFLQLYDGDKDKLPVFAPIGRWNGSQTFNSFLSIFFSQTFGHFLIAVLFVGVPIFLIGKRMGVWPQKAKAVQKPRKPNIATGIAQPDAAPRIGLPKPTVDAAATQLGAARSYSQTEETPQRLLRR